MLVDAADQVKRLEPVRNLNHNFERCSPYTPFARAPAMRRAPVSDTKQILDDMDVLRSWTAKLATTRADDGPVTKDSNVHGTTDPAPPFQPPIRVRRRSTVHATARHRVSTLAQTVAAVQQQESQQPESVAASQLGRGAIVD